MKEVAESTAYIFDMDGVIINSTPVHTEAWKLYLQNHGCLVHDIEARMLGRHNDEIVRDFFGAAVCRPEEVAEHGARKEALYRELMLPVFEEHLVPGIHDFLRSLRDTPAAIATNAELPNVEFVLDRAGIRPYFSAVVTGYEVSRPKPFPDVYLRAAELLGFPPCSCIVFEDSVTGVKAARAAGMRVVGLLTTLPTIPDVDLAVRDFRDPELRTWLSTPTACV